MKKFLFVFVCLVLFVTGCGTRDTQSALPQTTDHETALDESDVMQGELTVDDAETSSAASHKYIFHAGGITPDGITGSSSLEALNYSYERGYLIVEMDFCWTEDNHLVCVHDWDAYYAHRLGKECVTLEEFESAKYGTYGFTSMTLYDLADWMKEHEGAVIVTDIKERSVDGARLISEKYPDLLDRFYFQIYSKSDYDVVRGIGFNNIILTVYQLPWEEKIDAVGLAEYALNHELIGLTYPIELHEWYPDYTSSLLKANTPLYVHTVNDWEKQKQLFALGVSGVYTDNVNQ